MALAMPRLEPVTNTLLFICFLHPILSLCVGMGFHVFMVKRSLVKAL
jgi:hypothetical protein